MIRNFRPASRHFMQGLQQSGWTIGRNVRIDTRWATTNAADIRKHSVELAALAPDVILAHGTSTVGPLLQATRTVPIVFPLAVDPVGAGFVDSLARPGGNATGFMTFEYSISGKWLELLKQIAPGVTRAAILRNPDQGSGTAQFGVIQAVALALRMEVNPINMRDADQIERAVAAFAGSQNGGLIQTASGVAQVYRKLVIALAARQSCPRSTTNAALSLLAGWPPMGPITSISIGALQTTSTASSRARSRQTFRCRRRPSTTW